MATCLIRSIAIIMLLGGCVWMARLADINRRAPIVAQDASFCAVSPGGLYLAFFRSFNPQTSFLDTISHTVVEIPILPELSESKMLWLREELYFYYTTWEVRRSADREYNAPTNGWIVDVSAKTIQDINTLSATAQNDALIQAATASERQWEYPLPPISPDGRLQYFDAGGPAAHITLVNNYDVKLNNIDGIGYIHLCIPGWKSDSSGYYFIDQRPDSLAPGPIRLLLANPPPPYWTIAWLLLGVLLSAIILWYRWINQRILQWRNR